MKKAGRPKKLESKKHKVYSFTLPPELYEKAKLFCEGKNISLSSYIRKKLQTIKK
jgi:hypothetical protein